MQKKINSNYDSRRALTNTLMLYLRMFVCMFLGFYATRILLKSIGEEYYGLSQVLGSIVGLFSVVTSPLSVTAMRFSAVELGRTNSGISKKIMQTFNLLIVIYLMLVAALIVVGIPIILWVFFTRVHIEAVNIRPGLAYMFLNMLSLILELLKVPFWALVVSNENISFFSWISISDSLLRLVLFFVIGWLPAPLVMYGVVLCVISTFNLLIYAWYVHRSYAELHFSLKWDWPQIREILVFSLYQMGGGIAGVIYNSGISILLNNHFGTTVNASRGLATQVSTGVGSFTQSFLTAVNPQIIKTYSAREYDKAIHLVMRIGKMSFSLTAMAAVPCILCAPFLCKLWLHTPPEFTIIFVRLVLIQGIVDSFSYSLMTLSSASGKIALYQLVIGGMMVLLLPLSYVLLKLGYSPESVFVSAILCSACCLPLRLWLIHRVTPLPVFGYIFKVLVPCFLSFLIALPPVVVFMHFFPTNNLLFCSIVIFMWCILWGASVLYVGMSRVERIYVLGMVTAKLTQWGLWKSKSGNSI